MNRLLPGLDSWMYFTAHDATLLAEHVEESQVRRKIRNIFLQKLNVIIHITQNMKGN